MLNFLLTIISVITTALKRLRANAGLALCALVALIAAVALAVSIPVYAEGASLRLLKDEIAKQEQQNNRSPFALLFRYVGAWTGPLEWDRVKPADDFIKGVGLRSLGLPIEGLSRHSRTDQLRLFLPPEAVRSFEGRRFVVVREGERERRVTVKVGIETEDRAEITEGVEEGDVIVGQ